MFVVSPPSPAPTPNITSSGSYHNRLMSYGTISEPNILPRIKPRIQKGYGTISEPSILPSIKPRLEKQLWCFIIPTTLPTPPPSHPTSMQVNFHTRISLACAAQMISSLSQTLWAWTWVYAHLVKFASVLSFMCLRQTFFLESPFCPSLSQTLFILRMYLYVYPWFSRALHKNSSHLQLGPSRPGWALVIKLA